MRTHWLTRNRTPGIPLADPRNEASTGISGFSMNGAHELRELAPARAGVLHFDTSLTAMFDPINASLAAPLIPGTDLYPEAPGAGGDYVPAGSPFSDFLAQAQNAMGQGIGYQAGGRGPDAVNRYFEGDLFTNGALHMVYESAFERTALQTIWGNAFLRTPNTFNPIHPPDANYANVVTNGIGGWVTGQMALQPLESE